jgi:hypothetical protein
LTLEKIFLKKRFGRPQKFKSCVQNWRRSNTKFEVMT